MLGQEKSCRPAVGCAQVSVDRTALPNSAGARTLPRMWDLEQKIRCLAVAIASWNTNNAWVSMCRM
eukprot:6469421-Amphidinium_carterae.1